MRSILLIATILLGTCFADRKAERSVCVRVMNYVDAVLSENRTEAEIEQTLDRVCHYLPSNLKQSCDEFIVSHMPRLVQLSMTELTPEEICQHIVMCPTAVNSQLALPSINTPETKIELSVCSLCTKVMGYVESKLGDDTTQENVARVLESVCSFVPFLIKFECKYIIGKFTPILIQLFVDKLPADQICQKIKLCKESCYEHPFTTPNSKGYFVEEKTSSLECTECVEIYNHVESSLSDNSTTEELKMELGKVCASLDASLQDDCIILIDKNTPVLIELLKADFTPHEICRAFKLCDFAKRHVKSLHHQVIKQIAKKQTNKGVECFVCKHATNYVSLVEKNSAEKEIQQSVERVCNYLPTKMTSECNDFVEKYGAVLVKLIVADLTPDQICKSLDLCPQKPMKMQRSYWGKPQY